MLEQEIEYMSIAGRRTERSLEFRYSGFGANGVGVRDNVQEKVLVNGARGS